MMHNSDIFFKGDSKVLAVVCGDINFEYDLSTRTFRVECVNKFQLKQARPSVRFTGRRSDIVSTGDVQWAMNDNTDDSIETKELSIKINGKQNKGIVLKPE